MIRPALCALCLVPSLLLPAVAEEPAAVPAELNGRERAFKERLDDAVLVGHFTVDGREAADKLSEERYAIQSVDKINDDTWRFNVRIQYKELDLTLPLPLKVLWAGETPVITLDKLAIPPLGTFSARVLFHEDRYVGTWEHVGKAGGHLFGHVTHEEK